MSLARGLRFGLAAWLGCACLCPAPGAPVPLQNPPGGFYLFRSYGPEQGLGNPTVCCLLQDLEGYIWVGTEDGLFRYDGVRFQRYTTADGMQSNTVLQLSLAPDGDLYVGTYKGISVRKGERFEPLRSRELPDGGPSALAAGRGGRLFACVQGQCYEAEGRGPFRKVAAAPSKAFYGAWMSPDGSLLLASHERRLYRRLQGQWECRNLDGPLKESITRLLQDRQGRIWLRTKAHLYRLAAFDAPLEDLSGFLPDVAIQQAALAEDGQGRMWTATGKGLTCLDGAGAWPLGEKEGLPTNWGEVLLFDRQGNLWVGSEGLHRLLGRMLWKAYDLKHGLPGTTVWAIHRSRDGLLWVGTNRGVSFAEQGAWRTVRGTEGRSFNAFAEDGNGVLWACGDGNRENTNSLAYRQGGGGFRFVPVKSAAPSSILVGLAPLSGGSLLVGTVDDGVHRLTPNGTEWRSEAVALPGLALKEPIHCVASQNGEVWVATDHGLVLGDGRSWSRLDASQGLKENQISCMALHPGGDLWVCYMNARAITRLRKQGAAWRVLDHLESPGRLTGDIINSIAFEAGGVAWLGTSQGVKRWDGHRLEIFGRGEGLLGEDTAQNAIWIDPGGDAWFGTSNGLARFVAADYGGPADIPPVRLSALEDGRGRLLDLFKPAPRISYDARNLIFRFTALNFLNEAQQSYQTRMVGFEETWRDTTVPEVRYTALPPGAYRFEVRSLDRSGRAGKITSFRFTVQPPVWRRWWAILLELGAGLSLVLGYVRWRVAVLHRRTLQLESLVKERTRELESANAALENANAALAEVSMVDPLTELRNRRFLSLSMPEESARVQRMFRKYLDKGDDPLSHYEDLIFFMVDIDHFKSINDSYGHAAGDQVLQQVAKVMRSVCREADTLVRWGGEEFLVVAKRADRAHAVTIAGNILDAFRTHVFQLPGGVAERRTCSIGFAAFPFMPSMPDQLCWEETTEIADACLYAAKHSGRNGWVGVYAKPELQARRHAGPLPRHMEQAVREGALEVVCSYSDPSVLNWRHDISAQR